MTCCQDVFVDFVVGILELNPSDFIFAIRIKTFDEFIGMRFGCVEVVIP